MLSDGIIDHDKRCLIYVAGPYQFPDPVENTHLAIQVGERIQSSGYITAFVPHTTLLWHMVVPHPAEFWYDWDLAFLKRCDALLRIPGPSVGADNEVAYAHDHKIPVFIDEQTLIDWARQQVAF